MMEVARDAESFIWQVYELRTVYLLQGVISRGDSPNALQAVISGMQGISHLEAW